MDAVIPWGELLALVTPVWRHPPHAPYGTQIFLTFVECRRYSGPPPSTGSSQVRTVHSVHVRFMFPALSFSASVASARSPKTQIASTSSCPASGVSSSFRNPVTMLTTPPGRSRRVEDLVEIGRHQRRRLRRHHDDAISHRDRRQHQRQEPSSGASSGQMMPITPIGSGIASVTLRSGV